MFNLSSKRIQLQQVRSRVILNLSFWYQGFSNSASNYSHTELAKFAPKPLSTSLISSSSSSSSQHPNSSITPLVKHVLSRELQLYFTRLTEALGGNSSNSDNTTTSSTAEVREAALGSVRNDPGLHQLVPYLIAWGGEQVSQKTNYFVRFLLEIKS